MKALLVAAVALAVVPAGPAGPRVVSVRVGADAATGYVVGDGRVVTVAHVLGRDVRVDGRPARVLRRDDRLDLALLSVPGVEGRRGGRQAEVVRHARARIDGSSWRRPVLELRTDAEPGDSGTPVIDRSGRVIGVIFARSQERPGTAWAVECRANALCGI